MKQMMTQLSFLASALALATALSACEKQEGPAERAGKAVDNAMERAGEQVEKLGEGIQDAAKGESGDSANSTTSTTDKP